MSARNQKIIICNSKRTQSDYIGFSEVETALADLSKAGFVLAMYLAKNKKNFRLELSPEDVYKQTSIHSEGTYTKCVRELIKAGYLVQRKPGSNIYFFDIIPKPKTKTAEVAEVEPEQTEPQQAEEPEQAEPEQIETAEVVQWGETAEVEPQETEPEQIKTAEVEPGLVWLSDKHEILNVVNTALNAVCYKQHGKYYNGWQQISRKAVDDEIKSMGYNIGAWMKHVLDDNPNLIDESCESQTDVLPF